ncbi:MAG: sigma-54-dependent Fis family transcriptional regulator [Candidatus Aureabacteria bacterium]|nr:sigma-54-dependent Fis family transcriptional regulator [Candidatus Auribacterota bacterium]
MSYSILLVDDHKNTLKTWSDALQEEGYTITTAETGSQALALFQKENIDLVILDMVLPDIKGLDVLEKMKEMKNDALIIMITGYGGVETAVKAMKKGAYNYRTKPVEPEDLKESVKKAFEAYEFLSSREEVEYIRNRQKQDFNPKNIIGKSAQMTEIMDIVQKIAESESSTVLIRGETGTGKELIARAIHYLSSRRDFPFIDVNCTAIPENLLESELFGYEKGAFTDAKQSRKGVFELADGGTLFLDEIGDMSYAMQAKLLRVLQDKTFKKVGGSKNICVNVRIIASTNMDLEKAIRENKFREDLYYRLKVIPLLLPPLRKREDDALIIANYYLKKFNKEFKKAIKGFTADALKLIKSYSWPGNIRELRNVVERGVLLENVERLSAKHLMIHCEDSPFPAAADEKELFPEEVTSAGQQENKFELYLDSLTLEEAEKALIRKVLVLNNWNRNAVASAIGINRTTLYSKMKKYGITKNSLK